MIRNPGYFAIFQRQLIGCRRNQRHLGGASQLRISFTVWGAFQLAAFV